MFRRGLLARTGLSAGVVRITPVTRMFWGFKDSDMHRVARQRPWWEKAAIFAGLLAFINGVAAALYLGNRLYQYWRPSGNELKISLTLDEKLFSRPDLAVAAVRMLLHHAMSGTTTPFGDPMVAPPHLSAEAEELLEVVLSLHAENPMYSIPDLWAMLTAKALARLGGPNITVRRGRESTLGPDASVADLLEYPESLVPENRRDVLNMKRVLSREGFSLEQSVALIGCYRVIGFHDAANYHTTEAVRPHLRRNPSSVGPSTDDFLAPDLLEKCTLDPYVFGAEYFDLLLDYKWKQEGVIRKSDYYRCKQSDRQREVVLLDPFSEKTLESQMRRAEAEQRALRLVEDGEASMAVAASGKEASLYGRTGEAQFIKGMSGSSAYDQNVTVDPADDLLFVEAEDAGGTIDPCEHVSMRGVDVMLLDDALTRGWLHRFSENEIAFYESVGKVIALIQERGHNRNTLHEPRRLT